MLHLITDPADPRVAPYRELRDRHLQRPNGLFVAESELVVQRLLTSALVVRSVFAATTRAEAIAALRPDVDVFTATPILMKQLMGFPFHRGVLALGERPTAPTLPSNIHRALVIEDVTDVDNVGALIRTAVAFGVEAVIISPRCADPYYRKALRTAMGCTFSVPVVRAHAWPSALCELRERYHCRVIAAVADASASPLATYAAREPWALCVGSEGPGLTAAARDACDDAVTIPMAPGADSLNVAVAAAIILHHLRG